QHLEEQGGLPDPWLAVDEGDRPGKEAPGQDPVDLPHSGGTGSAALGVDGAERHRRRGGSRRVSRPTTGPAGPDGLFDQGVPGATFGTAADPAGGGAAAV